MKVKGMNLRICLVIGSAMVFASSAQAAKNLAKVNDRNITDKDLSMSLGGLNEAQRMNVLKDPNSRREILGNVIDQEVLAQEGEKLKLDQEAEFKELVNIFRKQLLVNRLLQKKLAAQITPAAMKKYYDLHIDRFGTDQVRLQHILLSTEEEARKIVVMAKASNADFQALAEKHSKDPSAKNNRGELGYMGNDRLAPEMAEVAFATKDGEVRGPIKTPYGYHVIKVIDKKPGKPLEFGEVELRIRDILQRDLSRNYTDNLRKQAKIKVDQEALDKLQ